MIIWHKINIETLIKLGKTAHATIPVSVQNGYLNLFQSAYPLNTARLFGVAPLCVAVNATLPPTGLCCLLAAAALS